MMISKNMLKFLEIVLIPLSILGFGIWFENSISDRQESLAVTQTIDSYFQGVAEIIANDKTEFRNVLILARSRAIVNQLRELKKNEEVIEVIRFLADASPEILSADIFEQDPQSDGFFLDLSDMDFSWKGFSIMTLNSAQFRGSSFQDGYIDNVECEDCGFHAANFRYAKFNMVSFHGADLSGADFTGSNINDVHLEMANLSDAIWFDGRKCKYKSIGKCN